MKRGPVKGIKSLKRNFEEYQRCVNMPSNSRATPSRVCDWYYAPTLKMVGASRFIGYDGMTCELYNSKDIELNGGDTQRYLQKWFDPLEKDDPSYSTAWELAEVLSKERSKEGTILRKARFYILKQQYDSEIRDC